MLGACEGQTAFLPEHARRCIPDCELVRRNQAGSRSAGSGTGGVTGKVDGLLTVQTDKQSDPEQVRWAEALRLSIDQKDGRTWLLIEPDIWIWPRHARADAANFLDRRRSDRYNAKHDAILNAWIRIILGTEERNTLVTLQVFDGTPNAGNPCFSFGTRTAFSRRRAS